MPVCAITCTGARWELFALCRRWVERQTVPVDHWVCGIDTDEDFPAFPMQRTVMVKLPSQGPDKALIAALDFVPKGHHAVVFEDDDWYGKDHVSRCVSRLEEGYMLTGGDTAVRFHLPARRWSGFHTPVGFIQGTTAIHHSFIRDYQRLVGTWPKAEIESHLKGRYDGFTTVGIKGAGNGLPGRPGFTRSHLKDHRKTTGMLPDPNHENFIKTVGEADARAYLDLLT